MLPFEFIVIGNPRSAQAKNRKRLNEWKQLVREAARQRWPVGLEPQQGSLQITVVYFHDRPTSGIDSDNLLKPILDTLAGLLYGNDRQIIDATTRMRNIDGAFQIHGMPPTMVSGFLNGKEFVYIRLDRVTDMTKVI